MAFALAASPDAVQLPLQMLIVFGSAKLLAEAFVVAQLGQAMGIIAPHVYGVVVFMSVATTLVVPPLLAVAYRGIHAVTPEQEELRLC